MQDSQDRPLSPIDFNLSQSNPDTSTSRSPRSASAFRRRASIWIPQTYAQFHALNSPAEILLFGGAAGGLKTETLLMDAVSECWNSNLRAVIFRTSQPQLEDVIRKSHRLYAAYPYLGRYSATNRTWHFPSNLREIHEAFNALRRGERVTVPAPDYRGGATIEFRHLSNDEDCRDHDGQEYSFIGYDESTHHAETQFRYLIGRLRSTDKTLFCRIRLATNPGNIGHAWHMRVFIGEECPHCLPNSAEVRKPFLIYSDAEFSDGTRLYHTTEFVPANVTDHRLFADGDTADAGNETYARRLELQEPDRAKALLEGCWSRVEGQFFKCWEPSRAPDSEGRDLRMVVPLAEAPVEWWHQHFTGTDWGCGSSQAASYLCAQTPPSKLWPSGRIYVLKEVNAPNLNIFEYGPQFLRRLVLSSCAEKARKIVACYLGPDSWNQRGDERSIAGQLNEIVGDHGIWFQRARNNREAGWQWIYRKLKTGELVICDTCKELIHAIRTRIHDPNKPGDIIKNPGDPYDDAMDALRYAIYSFDLATNIEKPKALKSAERLKSMDATSYMAWKANQGAEEEAEEEPIQLYPPSARQILRALERKKRKF